MTIRLRTVFLIGLVIFLVWFLYIEREILAPFVLGAIFAYIFNPIINFFSHKIKFPRTISIIIIYLIIISLLVFLSLFLARQIIDESSELKVFIANFLVTTKDSINNLPSWIKPMLEDSFSSFEKLKVITPLSVFSFFPQAISRIVSFVIFLFSAFYFLKEGKNMFNKLLNLIPNSYRIDVEILFRKINSVLKAYLRGQVFLIFLVSLMIFIALSILKLKFALILAIFSGIVEIVPILGPIIAITVAAIVALIVGDLNFSLSPISGAITVIIVFFVIRQFQDYFINPLIMGRITKLHPLVVLFAVLAGQHIWGILGVILAVPMVATTKIIIEFCLDKINSQKTPKNKV